MSVPGLACSPMPALASNSPMPHSTLDDYPSQAAATSSGQSAGGTSNLPDLESNVGMGGMALLTGGQSAGGARKRKVSESASSCSPTPSSTSRLGGSDGSNSNRGGKKKRLQEEENDDHLTPEEKAMKVLNHVCKFGRDRKKIPYKSNYNTNVAYAIFIFVRCSR